MGGVFVVSEVFYVDTTEEYIEIYSCLTLQGGHLHQIMTIEESPMDIKKVQDPSIKTGT